MAANIYWKGSALGKLWMIAMALAAALCAQDVPTFRTGVFLMHVDAEILGPNERPLIDLVKDDFRVLDDGTEQNVIAFSEGEQPLDLILLFDISGSMRKHVEEVAAAAHLALQELRKGDRVSVMIFNTEVGVVAPFSEDLNAVEEAVGSVLDLHFGGGTFIQDSIHEAANQFIRFDSRDQRRRAVLIVTDDFGRPAHSKMAVIESLWEADALLSGLVVHNRIAERLGGRAANRRGGIDDLVVATGGDIIRSDDLSASFPEMMHRIRNRYTLYYKLPEGQVGTLRRIDVQLSQKGCQHFPGAHVVARHAYRLRDRDQYGFASR